MSKWHIVRNHVHWLIYFFRMKKIFSQFEIPKPGAPGGEQMRWMALMALIGLGVANVFYFRSSMTTKEITMKEFFDLYLTKGLVCRQVKINKKFQP